MRPDVTALIADDEPLLRRHLNQSLADLWPQLTVVATADNGETALEAIHQHQPDIVFLDIRMPKLDGMALANKLKGLIKPPLVVFVTAFDEYALRAFDTNAADYLLKAVTESRLQQCCERLQQRLQSAEQTAPDMTQLISQLSQLNVKPSYLTWLKASKGEEIHLIAAADVLYLKAEDKYLSVYKQGERGIEEYLLRSSLKDLLAQLNPEQFWQIHRSVAVNVAKVDKVKKDFTGKMYVYIGERKLAVSRALQSQFK
ncbi:LytTR family DNA-binding domain-containing protein [Vibrio fluvialis]|uniref:LytR/AlgR family response regulator transcription factor n=1 Tax=Vibrio fluvialis TaxID=676 RepID=UPI000C2219F5|nr:LytTR family DNA-binding domain-containing protein [Vibrio fluvialis]MBY7826938.1 LytTR family DNA-binding domain-containing protein [Vibrio fluvialis]MBY7886166.1 LytTR family DNA-binding domain-containing protein [Vibrio fluvialis]MBY7929271.1 LytTR family DNA-binding domain-containing protein [Vibrio fluvialis]MBY8010788.1 LytTR family DNA-binding domain-containing protein [Vibrio fluvialis]MBY8255040.1 LytTR family DNA-binding domain-containing protein [Vibrio fluvialis]